MYETGDGVVKCHTCGQTWRYRDDAEREESIRAHRESRHGAIRTIWRPK